MIHFHLPGVAGFMVKSHQDCLVENIFISAITKYEFQTKLVVIGKLKVIVAFPDRITKNHFQ